MHLASNLLKITQPGNLFLISFFFGRFAEMIVNGEWVWCLVDCKCYQPPHIQRWQSIEYGLCTGNEIKFERLWGMKQGGGGGRARKRNFSIKNKTKQKMINGFVTEDDKSESKHARAQKRSTQIYTFIILTHRALRTPIQIGFFCTTYF